jgi:hypothetical protein
MRREDGEIMLIAVSALRPADIIVSTTNASVSAVIRAGIGSSVSHSMIYVGGGFVVEAVERGVLRNQLTDALDQAVLAIALRRRNLTEKQRADVIKYATQFMWRPYDKIGAAGSGTSLARGGLLAAFGCGISLMFCGVGTAGVVNNARPEVADRAFFCSELVARVFELAGAPILEGSPSFTTPRHIRVANTLMIMGTLVDKPVGPPPIARGGPAQGAEGAGGF